MPEITETEKKAFDFAADLTKQLITLATSIVTVTLLFDQHFPSHSKLAKLAWTLFLLSTVCGLWTLMALTGTLSPRPNTGGAASAQSYQLGTNVRLPSALQIALFALAILTTLLFVYRWY